jgi:hypothetical protein
MSYPGTISGAETAVEMAAIAQAVKASGAIVRVEPKEFMNILSRTQDPLVVYSPKKFWGSHKYLTGYKGLIFYTKARIWFELGPDVEVVTAKTIWVPN